MPNPTVILASSTSLLHPLPFWRGMWRQSFPIPPLKVLTQEEQSGPRKLQKDAPGQLHGWKARRTRQQLLGGTFPPVGPGSRTLALPAAFSSLHKINPMFESSCWLSCLVRPQSRKPQREVDLLKFSTRSQAALGSQQASKGPGPPAVPA